MNKFWHTSGLVLLALLLIASMSFAQSSRDVRIGTMGHSAGEDISVLNLRWPLGWNNFSNEMSGGDINGITIGIPQVWETPSGVDENYHISQGVAGKFTDPENSIVRQVGEFKRVFKHPVPHKYVDTFDWTPTLDRRDETDPTIPSDVMTYGKWLTDTDIQIERWTYAFADAAHDDAVIVEWLFTNASGAAMNDAYFGINSQFMTTSHYPADLWADYDIDNRVYYMWDADHVGSPEDDRGNPDVFWGNFEEPQFIGVQVVHADKSAADASDDMAQPFKAGWSQRELLPSLSEYGHTDLYEFLSEPWDPANPNLYTPTSPFYREFEWDNYYNLSPETEQSKGMTLSFGPYDINDGEDVRVVLAFAGGSISSRLAIDLGRAYNSGYTNLQENLKAMDYNYGEFELAGKILDHSVPEDKKLRDDVLNTGIDSLYANLEIAKMAWMNGSVAAGSGSFSFEMAPPTPTLEGFSEADQIRLAWGDEADSYSDLKGFRIYRNFWRPAEKTEPTDTSFILVAEVGKDVHEFIDDGSTTPTQPVVRGEAYYYFVTAVTNNGVESSPFQTRMGFGKSGADKLKESVSLVRAPDANWKDNVVVVPNPYHLRGAYKYGGKKLNFLNTPAYCNIHIYTMTGDKVMTIEHNVASGDESYDRQDTFSTMELVSGVYVFVVEELDAPNGNATGETAIGKFVVVK